MAQQLLAIVAQYKIINIAKFSAFNLKERNNGNRVQICYQLIHFNFETLDVETASRDGQSLARQIDALRPSYGSIRK